MSFRLTRRDFLKLSGAAAVGLAFRDFPPGGDPASNRPPTFLLGRAIYSLRYYEQPSLSSKELGFYNRDSVLNIHEEKVGDPEPVHNPIWLRTDDGWVYSGYVQPVKDELNTPILKIPSGGMLVKVTVPYTDAWRNTPAGLKRIYRCYYASTYWATYSFENSIGKVWYQIYDERYEESYIIQAEHMRPVTAEEVSPLSPDRKDKWIQVDLGRQRLIAFEGERPVFTTRIASGYFEGDTPKGEFHVERKQPSRHMASNVEGNGFDLPGVPWVSYISWTGVSMHGTYWHNNFGKGQSHGCINLTPEAAQWVYRWTDPFVPVNKDYVESDLGTRVVVI